MASYTESRDFSFDGRVAVHKGLFYKPIDVEKEHCVSALNGTTKRSGRILVADWLQKKGKSVQTKTKHGRRQSLKKKTKKEKKRNVRKNEKKRSLFAIRCSALVRS